MLILQTSASVALRVTGYLMAAAMIGTASVFGALWFVELL